MNPRIYIFFIASALPLALRAQGDTTADRARYPLLVTLQFHNLAMPFRDLGSNFSHPGVGLGTEVSINRRGTWVQQVSALWFRNRTVGNGLMVYTQNAWRPTIGRTLYSEVKGGAGYFYAFRPVQSFRQENGEWVSVGRRGRGMLAIPLGITMGYKMGSRALLSPFISYQVLFVAGYNASVPLVPESLIQVGSRIRLSR